METSQITKYSVYTCFRNTSSHAKDVYVHLYNPDKMG